MKATQRYSQLTEFIDCMWRGTQIADWYRKRGGAMPRVKSLDTNSSRPSPANGDGDRSLLYAARRQRMLRELGYSSSPYVDSYVDPDSDRSAGSLGLSIPPDHQKACEELQAQLEVERRLRAEAIKLAEAIKKEWEEAEARMRIEIEFRVQAERKAREEAEARLEIERKAREETERVDEKRIDTAGLARAEPIITSAGGIANGFGDLNPVLAQALAEMMARVHAEQQAIMEKRARVAFEDRAQTRPLSS